MLGVRLSKYIQVGAYIMVIQCSQSFITLQLSTYAKMKIQFTKEFDGLQCSAEVYGIVFLNYYAQNSFDDLHLVFFFGFSFAVLADDSFVFSFVFFCSIA